MGDHAPSCLRLCPSGNVSSSTTWYTLGYIETVRGVQKNDTVLQVGVGSGIKCGVNYWQGGLHLHLKAGRAPPSPLQALRDVDDLHEAWQHRASPERLAQLNAPPVDGRHAMVHMAMRVIFMLVMGIIMWLFMLLQEPSHDYAVGHGASGLGSVQPQQLSAASEL
eukprot:1136484-Pelagomonas_calceolata.AAC.8